MKKLEPAREWVNDLLFARVGYWKVTDVVKYSISFNSKVKKMKEEG